VSKEAEGHIICHTHWDREWFAPTQVTNEWLLELFDNLEKVIERADEEFVYVLDGQTLVVEDFMKASSNTSLKERIKELIAEQRLIIGPLYAQIDFRLSSELTILKNLEMGRKDMQVYKVPSEATKVAWMVDNFGFVGQIPQLLKMFDIGYATIWRGVDDSSKKPALENIWQGSDSTEVKTLFLIGGYRNLYNLSSTRKVANERYELEIEKSKPFSFSGKVPLLDGYDLDTQPENPKEFLKNDSALLSSPSKIFEKLDFSKAHILHGEQISGKYACTFPGTLSTRIYLKQQAYYTEKLINIAQFLRLVTGIDQDIDSLWREYVKNMVHDNICGVGIDYVHSSMERSFQTISNTARELIRTGLTSLMNMLQLPSGTYSLNLSNYAYNTWYSTDKYCFKLNTKGTTLSYIDMMHKMEDRKGEKQDQMSLKCGLLWENEFYKANFSDNRVIVSPKNAQNAENSFEVGELMLLEETGDAYTTSRKIMDFEVKVKSIRVQYLTKHNMILELNREIWNTTDLQSSKKGVFIRTKEIIIFDETPVIKWKIKTRAKGTNYVLAFRGTTHKQEGDVIAKMPFEIVRRGRKVQNLFGKNPPPSLKSVLLAARELESHTFPFQGFVGIDSPNGLFSLFARGLKEYSVSDNGDIEITLIRSVEWIAKRNVKGRIGDAGPLIYVPSASCEGRDLNFNLGIYVDGQNRIDELYKWFTLFDDPPLLFRFRQRKGAIDPEMEYEKAMGDLEIKIIDMDVPWLPFSDDEVIVFNPFSFDYGCLKAYKIGTRKFKDLVSNELECFLASTKHECRREGINDLVNEKDRKVRQISFIEIPYFQSFKQTGNSTDRIVASRKDLKRLSANMQSEIRREKENLRHLKDTSDDSGKSKCDFIKVRHKILTLQRTYQEIKISSLLLKKTPFQIKDVLAKFNKTRAKRRVYDYLVEICSSKKSKN